MNWEEKFGAIRALSGHWDTALYMRAPGDWYVVSHLEVSDGDFLMGGCDTGCATPEAAVEHHWARLTNLKHGEAVAVSKEARRRYYKWRGFMWEDVTDEFRAMHSAPDASTR